MAISPASRWLYAVSFALVAAGFLMPLWPLCVVGLLLCALSGRWLFALFLGLLLDVAWGAPTGLAQYLFLPFTLCALAAAMARLWGGSYFLERGARDTL